MNGYVGAFKFFVYGDGHHKLEYKWSLMATMLVTLLSRGDQQESRWSTDEALQDDSTYC